jgi:hypothetical protein
MMASSGTVLYNGQPLNKAIKKRIGYVLQVRSSSTGVDALVLWSYADCAWVQHPRTTCCLRL